MELKIEMKQQLEQLLAKPAKVTQNDIPLLHELIATYPYYQPLYLLLAKASKDQAKQQETFTKAALYNNGHILHRIIHAPQQLNVLHDVEVIQYPTWQKKALIATDEDITAISKPIVSDKVEEAPEIENLAPLASETIEVVEIPLAVEDHPQDVVAIDEQKASESVADFPFPEIENIAPLQSEIIKVCDAPAKVEGIALPETDEQETFDEISELVLPTDFVANQTNELEDVTPKESFEKHDSLEPDFKAEAFASTDFFAFDLGSAVAEETQSDERENIEVEPDTEKTPITPPVADNVVSKYDDDKLPFTFLWWLAKTRKDHEQIFRPFVSTSKGLAPAQHLQQQYVENIFHLQAPFELDNDTDLQAEPKNKKESEIIESFIKNDPQIKALPPNQINTENKAKKSAEDGNDLVSETLAQIYIEQMLYHKAIDTYQKLSLKFPEKSRYFADLIQSLEKKI
jgi:hypothetical protein